MKWLQYDSSALIAVAAVFFQTYLATCAFGLQLVTILVTGLDVEEMWINPLSESTSFSDFWGRRWNLSVHNALKRGVFKPARRYFPKCIALGATFLASGLFHEWIVWLVFSPLSNDEQRFNEDCDAWKCYTPTYSPAVVFFMFQGFLISIEFLMSQQQKKLLRDNIPGSIATLLIICIGGSLAHFFSDAYVHSSFYVGACVAYPVIKPINQYGG